MLRIARRAAATLRRVGQPTIVVSALRHARSVADQAGLDRQARERNQRESMIACRSISHAVAGRCIILADDIVTTGATLREGVRALGRAGVEPCGAVVVAAAT
jgi:predicted amidophosphoribosyltransferase